MLSRAETQVFCTREAEQVEQLIRKVRPLRSATSANVEQTLIGAGEAVSDRAAQETLLNAGRTVAVDASTVSFFARPGSRTRSVGLVAIASCRFWAVSEWELCFMLRIRI